MDVSTLMRSVREYLAASLGPDAEVCAAEDEFSALSVLLASAPGHCRVVVFAGELEAIGGDPEGLGCLCTIRVAVQVRRGLGVAAAAKAEAELLTAEKAVRNWLLAARYHHSPEETELAGHVPANPPAPHGELGTWRFIRSGVYESPVQDVAVEHPARELRMAIPIALAGPARPERVFI